MANHLAPKINNILLIIFIEPVIDTEYISIPDPRGVCLATLFTRGMLYHANAVVGYVIPKEDMLNLNNFDGQLFQWMYLKAKTSMSVNGLLQYLPEEKHLEFEKIYMFVSSDGNKIRL